MLKDKLIEDRNAAMRDLTKKTLLNTVIGELDRVSKTPTDADVLKVIKKIIEANKEIGSELALKENEILSVYLPQMMTTHALTEKISEFIVSNNLKEMRDMGKVMSYLSQNFAGLYDGKDASNIVKECLVFNSKLNKNL